jgi:hypothetical protein
LEFLDLEQNPGLVGELPLDWGSNNSFPKLANLWLNACSFVGELPKSWATKGAFASIKAM